jgi:hypothetical protein
LHSHRSRPNFVHVSYRFSISIFIPILILVATAGVGATDLVADGGFDTGVTGWRLVGRGSLSWSAGEGSIAPGSLHLEGGRAGGRTQAIAGYCLASLPPLQNLSFSVRVKPVTGTPSYCRIALFESERSDCRWIGLGAERRSTAFSIGWTQLPQAQRVTGVATRSVEVRLHCSTAEGATGPLEVLFDDVSVTTTSGLIFADDFESHGTSRWSGTVP